MKKGTYVHRNIDALDAYWSAQNQKIKQLERFVEQGGSISPELKLAIEELQNCGMKAYEQMIRGQNMLLSYLDKSEPIAIAAAENRNEWANEVIDAIDTSDPESIKRYEVCISPCAEAKNGDSALPKSGIILMLGESDAYGTALKGYLSDRGLRVKHIEGLLDEEQAEAVVAEAAGEGEIVGMAVLGNRYYGAEDSDSYYDYIMTVAHLIKRFVIYIRAGKNDRRYLFLFNTFMDGRLGLTGKSEHYHYGTLGGMAKCIKIELRESVYVKEIDFEPEQDASAMLGYLEDELSYADELQEVGRGSDGIRYRLDNKLSRSVVTENRCPIGENDVLLVSGGSRGVTSSCIYELAKRIRCKLVILGRAQISEDNNDDAETEGIVDPKVMKTLIAKRFKAQGFSGSFAAIEKKAKAILAQRDMLKTFEKLRSTGNPVYYYSCDVCDREGMKRVIPEIEREVGKISGVVHGAGIVADSKIWNKDMKAFRQVFDTKYKGLNNIMDNVDKESLKLLVMFSSVSGYFGNDGQMDYVAANEYMDKYAYYIRNRYPGCRALAINWGAWNGGMVYLDAMYIRALRERGYILIPLEVGANYFANDFLMGLPATQIMINNTGEPADKMQKGVY